MMFRHCFRGLLPAGLLLSLLLAVGCGKPPNMEDRAERVVEEFLDAWSRNEPPDKFAAEDGRIQGSDPDWKAGYRLSSFLTAETTPSQDKPDHVRCRVSLVLQDRTGKTREKKVVYDVQLGDKNIIQRVSP